jgi:hypothetical protein
LTYQKPSAAIEKLLNAPPTPVAKISFDHRMLLVEQPQTFPTIAEVAQPRLDTYVKPLNPVLIGSN